MKYQNSSKTETGNARKWLAGIVLAGGLTTAALAAQVQSIQIGAYDTQAEAEAIKAALPKNVSPAFIYDSGQPAKRFKVCLGHFPVYADAFAYKSKLKPGTFPDSWITSVTVEASAVKAAALPVELPFKLEEINVPNPLGEEVLALGGFTAEPEPPAELFQKAPEQMSREELVQVGMAISKRPFQAAPALETLLAKHGNAPEATKAKLRLARVLGRGQNPAKAEALLAQVIKSGKPAERITARFLLAHTKYNKNANDEAYEGFRALASDKTVPSNIRRECMRRAAGTAHRNGKLQDAWLCFAQIAESSPDPKAVAEARLQQAGLALELAGREKGTYDEARALCVDLAEDPATPVEIQATARLMNLETFFHEKRYVECLEAAEAFLAQHGDIVREAAVARGFRGMALLYLQRVPEAKVVLTETAETHLEPEQQFARLDPRPRAAIWLAYIAQAEGNTAERDRWINFIQSDYPDGEEARTIANLFPAIETTNTSN